jgi:hypothetical protein
MKGGKISEIFSSGDIGSASIAKKIDVIGSTPM